MNERTTRRTIWLHTIAWHTFKTISYYILSKIEVYMLRNNVQCSRLLWKCSYNFVYDVTRAKIIDNILHHFSSFLLRLILTELRQLQGTKNPQKNCQGKRMYRLSSGKWLYWPLQPKICSTFDDVFIIICTDNEPPVQWFLSNWK